MTDPLPSPLSCLLDSTLEVMVPGLAHRGCLSWSDSWFLVAAGPGLCPPTSCFQLVPRVCFLSLCPLCPEKEEAQEEEGDSSSWLESRAWLGGGGGGVLAQHFLLGQGVRVLRGGPGSEVSGDLGAGESVAEKRESIGPPGPGKRGLSTVMRGPASPAQG